MGGDQTPPIFSYQDLHEPVTLDMQFLLKLGATFSNPDQDKKPYPETRKLS